MKYTIEQIGALEASARKHLIDFSILTDANYCPGWHHRIMAEELEKVANGEFYQSGFRVLVITLPPRHGKTELATKKFPAWFLGNKPNEKIITVSYSDDLSVEFGRDTRNILSSQSYQRIFRTRLSSDATSKNNWKTQENGGYTSTGLGGAITGKGANVLLLDDLIKNGEEADSETYRNRVWSEFKSTLLTRLEPNGVIVIVMTRWHLDDLVGRIDALEDFKGKIKKIDFPAIAIQDEKHRKTGDALWPERFTKDVLEERRKMLGPYTWSALYQQRPISSENQCFKSLWFKTRKWEELRGLKLRKFLTIDTSLAENSNSDFIGICENYIDSQGMWNLKAYRLRLKAEDFVQWLLTIGEKSWEKIGIEKTAYLVGLKPFIEKEMRERGKFLPIIELSHRNTEKEVRIKGLIPKYANGEVYHIEGECMDAEEEFLTFPKGIHDDVIDAIAYQNQIVETTNIIPEKVVRQEDEEMMRLRARPTVSSIIGKL